MRFPHPKVVDVLLDDIPRIPGHMSAENCRCDKLVCVPSKVRVHDPGPECPLAYMPRSISDVGPYKRNQRVTKAVSQAANFT